MIIASPKIGPQSWKGSLGTFLGVAICHQIANYCIIIEITSAKGKCVRTIHKTCPTSFISFVCAVSPQAPSVCQKFRSYKSPEKGIDVTVIEAIRATCAVPDRFTSVKVGLDHQKQEFIAGDAAFYNLTQQAIKELYDSTSPDTLVSCVLSLGCGKPGIIQASTLYSSHQYNHRRTAIMQAERIADELEARIGSSGVYYRFSVDYGLESPEAVLLHRLGDIETYSRTYLQQAVTNTAMDKCVNASENVSRITTKTICGFCLSWLLP